jgi:hypothetical protein
MAEIIQFPRRRRSNVVPVFQKHPTVEVLRAIVQDIERVNAPMADFLRSVNSIARSALPPDVQRVLRLSAELAAPRFSGAAR